MNADDLAKVLDELGKRLGPAGEHVFQLAVRQQVINGVLNLVTAVAAAALAFGLLRFVNRYAAEDKARARDHPYHTSSYELAYVFGGVGVLILAAVAALCGSAAATCLLNPEYAAIRDLLQAIR